MLLYAVGCLLMDSSRPLATFSQTIRAAHHRGGCGRRDPSIQWFPAERRAPVWARRHTRGPSAPLAISLTTSPSNTDVWIVRVSCPAQAPPLSWLSRSSAPCTAKHQLDGTSAALQYPTNTQVHSLLNILSIHVKQVIKHAVDLFSVLTTLPMEKRPQYPAF